MTGGEGEPDPRPNRSSEGSDENVPEKVLDTPDDAQEAGDVAGDLAEVLPDEAPKPHKAIFEVRGYRFTRNEAYAVLLGVLTGALSGVLVTVYGSQPLGYGFALSAALYAVAGKPFLKAMPHDNPLYTDEFQLRVMRLEPHFYVAATIAVLAGVIRYAG